MQPRAFRSTGWQPCLTKSKQSRSASRTGEDTPCIRRDAHVAPYHKDGCITRTGIADNPYEVDTLLTLRIRTYELGSLLSSQGLAGAHMDANAHQQGRATYAHLILLSVHVYSVSVWDTVLSLGGREGG